MNHSRQRVSHPPRLNVLSRLEETCLELTDHSTVTRSAVRFFRLEKHDARTVASEAARQASHFVKQNRPLAEILNVHLDHAYDGNQVQLVLQSHELVGAIPLIAPQSAQMELGLVVQPRFPWSGIGPMLAATGWRITPTPLKLPLLHRSERRVPPWVLSSMVFARLQALIDAAERRFTYVIQESAAPKGSVLWSQYVARQLAAGKFHTVPCRFPDLQQDRQLLSAVRFTLDRHLGSLSTQRSQGSHVTQLIEFGSRLALKVVDCPPRQPSPETVSRWLRRPLKSPQFLEGIQAIEWTLEERGLAGTSDLAGIPWRLPMDHFFEAWVEVVLEAVAKKTGGVLKVGRKQQTDRLIRWDPPHSGSQRSLKPDLWLESDSWTLIVDAKYKRHWEELQRTSWRHAEQELREQHRNDLLQVLAYATLSASDRTIVCLAYPCSPQTYESLHERDRLVHRADIDTAGRAVSLWLTAVPMGGEVAQIAANLAMKIRQEME